jgi:hypothetical protein
VENLSVSALVGKTLASVERIADTGENPSYAGSDERITFTTTDGEQFQMLHYQDCCESVWVEDIEGDLQDLVGTPIEFAEESTAEEGEVRERGEDSSTWTFYRLRTIKGSVVIRWCGSSNGYYSESVDFVKVR